MPEHTEAFRLTPAGAALAHLRLTHPDEYGWVWAAVMAPDVGDEEVRWILRGAYAALGLDCPDGL